ncbi:hypothetical protein GGR44_000808 [Sphingobium fontiphilum]|uniref:Uncharacterized protein n=1 Tax=Sphingobium fontiphilum TaxID=944425 RepID=A0A7W6DIG8_9SPHN|nr:hypothetical protein [Sphingobium fontiphilum]MBB3981177.1 hypothetical protein [Sphingobium fontiphilum]
MRGWMLLALALPLSACTGSYEPAPLTEKQLVRLEKELAGKQAGEKTSCISRFPSTNLRVISDNVLIYRVSSKLVYRNDLIGSCTGISRGDTLVVRSFSSQYCRGDIARAVDMTTQIVGGSCALGDFTAYRTPSKK